MYFVLDVQKSCRPNDPRPDLELAEFVSDAFWTIAYLHTNNLFYLFSEYCIDRIKYLKITSFDYILVVGCTEDYVTISAIGSSIHKEKIGILVVILDMISVIYMAFIF